MMVGYHLTVKLREPIGRLLRLTAPLSDSPPYN
jgi:hypothetical protein